MKRGRRGEVSDELIWILGQIVFAVLVFTVLYLRITTVFEGGSLAQRAYAGDIGLLATAVAQSPEPMVVKEYIAKYGTTEFKVSLSPEDVTVASGKNEVRFWALAPKWVVIKDSSKEVATGGVTIVRSGQYVSIGESKDSSPACPQLETQDENGLWKKHYLFSPKTVLGSNEGMEGLLKLLQVRLPNSVFEQGSVDGLALAVVKGKRAVVYYNPDSSFADASRKLGCLLVGKIGSGVVMPSLVASLPGDRPGVLVVIPEILAADPLAAQDVLASGVVSYYG